MENTDRALRRAKNSAKTTGIIYAVGFLLGFVFYSLVFIDGGNVVIKWAAALALSIFILIFAIPASLVGVYGMYNLKKRFNFKYAKRGLIISIIGAVMIILSLILYIVALSTPHPSTSGQSSEDVLKTAETVINCIALSFLFLGLGATFSMLAFATTTFDENNKNLSYASITTAILPAIFIGWTAWNYTLGSILNALANSRDIAIPYCIGTLVSGILLIVCGVIIKRSLVSRIQLSQSQTPQEQPSPETPPHIPANPTADIVWEDDPKAPIESHTQEQIQPQSPQPRSTPPMGSTRKSQ